MDHYAILAVEKTASQEDIRKAYIKQSLIWHPDRNPDPEAKKKFQEIANAYFVLSDPIRRKEYDLNHTISGTTDPFKLFASVFDDLLIPEIPNPVWFFQPLGGVAGVCLGFIIFNIPGACLGYYFGSKMGKVRDMKGVCVYEAFSRLSSEKRGQILSELGKKLFKTAITQ